VTTSDWIQVWIAASLTATLAAVVGYVLWTRLQAEATKRIARATLQPVLDQWVDVDEQVIKYWNVGMGPALNIRWQLDEQTDRRLAMGIRDEKGKLGKFDLSKAKSPATLVTEYEDVEGTCWRSTLELNQRDYGKWENGTPSYGPCKAANRFKRAFDELLR
jgi:hypothetical protein